ncbi:uncharacterized protein LOC121853465 [Homarus americanus]|uniref:uncharacterized protein LOC121853465 n=1 Tax=Homarus americanus TaxID=6706 RepID=UPI001C44B1E7|nr:uncharacterized protein LOC121853465 [Homarus americanus]
MRRRQVVIVPGLLLVIALYLSFLSIHKYNQSEVLSLATILTEPQPLTLVNSTQEKVKSAVVLSPKTPHTPVVSSPASVDDEVMTMKISSRNETKEMNFVPRNKTRSDKMSKRKKKGKKRGKKKKWPMSLEPSSAAILRSLNYFKFLPQDRQFVKERVRVMVERASRVGEVCRSSLSHQDTINTHWIWQRNHTPSVIWCNEPEEVAPLHTPSGKKHHRAPSSAPEKADVFQHSLRVIVVNHPFVKLLSLYRDKIGTEEPVEPKYRNLRERIMSSVYQSSSSSWSSPSSLSSFPTFPEFVQYVIDSINNVTSVKEWRQSVKCLMPYWAECGVCANDFNIIIKAETMTEDEQFFLTVADLGHSNMEVVKQQEEVKVQQQEVVEGQQEVSRGSNRRWSRGRNRRWSRGSNRRWSGQQQEVVEGQQQEVEGQQQEVVEGQQQEVVEGQQQEVVEGQQQEVVKGQQQEVVEGQQQKESSAAAAAVKRKESPWEEVTRYYSQLTRHQMTELHQRYKLDFDLFGYEIDAYLAWPEMD